LVQSVKLKYDEAQLLASFDFKFTLRLYNPDGGPLVVRVGLHTGETVGGVVGQKMLRQGGY
jgi:class 3 adenylate cyclase